MTFPRYPKYKDSGVEWLGEVPEEWDVAPLKRYLSINNGKDHKHVEQEAGYPVYGSGGVFAWAEEYLYEGEAVLLGRKGTIDKPLYVNEKFWTVDTMFYAIANKNANSKYFYYVSTQIPFDLYSTNTALPSMTQSTLGSHIVAAPKINEQSKIVAFLDNETAKIDALIAEQNKLVELLKEKRQGIISHAVTKGLNPKAKMKDSGVEWLGEVPEGWEVISLRRIVKEHRQGYYSSESYSDSGIKLLRITDLKEYGNVSYDTCPMVEDREDVKEFILQAGDFVFARTGGAGSFGLIGDISHRVAYASYLIRFRFLSNVLPGFMRFYFLSVQFMSGIQKDIHGGVNQNVHAEDIKNQIFILPSVGEQNDILEFLEYQTVNIDKLINEANKASDLLKERRSAIISAAVTGKIDIRGAK